MTKATLSLANSPLSKTYELSGSQDGSLKGLSRIVQPGTPCTSVAKILKFPPQQFGVRLQMSIHDAIVFACRVSEFESFE